MIERYCSPRLGGLNETIDGVELLIPPVELFRATEVNEMPMQLEGRSERRVGLRKDGPTGGNLRLHPIGG